MAFVCECGFRAELSAEQRQRLAASGGRAKCPKCGKINTPRIPNEMAVEPPQISSSHGNEIEALLGMTEDTRPNEPSQQSHDPVESVAAVSPPRGETIDGGKSRSRSPSKDYVLFGAIGCNLFLSLVAFGFPLSRVEDVLKLQKRVTELENELEHKDQEILKTVGKALDVMGPHIAEKCRSLSVVDADGKTRIMLFSDDSTLGTGIEFYDNHAERRLQIVVEKNGQSVVRHFDRNGRVRVGSGIIFTKDVKEGVGAFLTYDAEGNLIR